jgi:hypothetical protein
MMSSVRNIGTQAYYFDFLPPHGKLLGVEQEYTCFGYIMDYVSNGLGGERSVFALANAINQGLLEIKYTPQPIFWDKGHKESSAITVFNGQVVQLSPCWQSAGPAIGPDGTAPFLANVVFGPPGQGSP